MQISGSAATYGTNGVSAHRESFDVQWLTSITKELYDFRYHNLNVDDIRGLYFRLSVDCR